MPEALPGGVVRGSGWRVRVGVVVRGGVLERLLRGVPPMGDGNVGGVWGCSGKVTGGVGMRLTYCQRSCGCLLVADVGLGDAVGNVLLAAGGEVADWLLSAVGMRPAKEGSWTMAWMSHDGGGWLFWGLLEVWSVGIRA